MYEPKCRHFQVVFKIRPVSYNIMIFFYSHTYNAREHAPYRTISLVYIPLYLILHIYHNARCVTRSAATKGRHCLSVCSSTNQRLAI